MPLGDVVVRADWREVEASEHRRRAANKSQLQLALVTFGLFALGAAAWRDAPGWLLLLQLALFTAAFLWMPLRVGLPDSPDARRTLSVAAAALAAMILLAALTAPGPRLATPPELAGGLPPALSLLIPAGMAALLLWATKRHSGLAHALGLSSRTWGYQLAVGLFLGLALGLHLWIIVAAIPNGGPLPAAPTTAFIWQLAVIAGIVTLGEEIALRGALFPMLTAEARGLSAGAVARMIVFAAPLYLGLTVRAPQGAPMPVGLLYGVIFTLMAVGLRYGMRSVVAPLAAGIAFRVMLLLAVYP